MLSAYELMVETNHNLIKGVELTAEQKESIVRQLLAEKHSKMSFVRNNKSTSGFTNKVKRRMAPEFFIPPYNEGKFFRTIFGQMPKTHILSANMYELEILRLLALFYPNEPEVEYMVEQTLERLRTTCFGYQDDGVGECFDASLVVLRFLITAAPDEREWIQSRIDNYNRHYSEKKRSKYCRWYYWLCLSEMPFTLAEAAIEKHKEEMLFWLKKSYPMNSEQDKKIYPVYLCVLRNIMANYPEYVYIKEKQPYVAADGRLHFGV